ncbi:hypothetical protein CBR_g17043 [Chara braunii]|uniref:Uncharacterized protein n=1 Tax=Chara braunii TaxID=69332 RepID=A0A388KUM9_CHABU|nr:hypothetical protein CBR_g17043 [Chara braunii]|eukprot:GBG73702.1 hypothetical protein CBR_g17043 [Chara braunii]
MAAPGSEPQANVPVNDWAETQEPSIIVSLDSARNVSARTGGRSIDICPPTADLGSRQTIPWGDSIAGHSIASDSGPAATTAIVQYDAGMAAPPPSSQPRLLGQVPNYGNYPPQQFPRAQGPFPPTQGPFPPAQAQFPPSQAPFPGAPPAPYPTGGGVHAPVPSKSTQTTPLWESLLNIVCFAVVLLLTIIVVALLGGGKEEESYFDTFKVYQGATFLLSMSVIVWPFVIAMLVFDIISAAQKSSFYHSNTYILVPITTIYVVLSYMYFGATCAALRGVHDFRSIFSEAYPFAKELRSTQMFLGASILGLFACVVFMLPLPLLVIRSVDKLI